MQVIGRIIGHEREILCNAVARYTCKSMSKERLDQLYSWVGCRNIKLLYRTQEALTHSYHWRVTKYVNLPPLSITGTACISMMSCIGWMIKQPHRWCCRKAANKHKLIQLQIQNGWMLRSCCYLLSSTRKRKTKESTTYTIKPLSKKVRCPEQSNMKGFDVNKGRSAE